MSACTGHLERDSTASKKYIYIINKLSKQHWLLHRLFRKRSYHFDIKTNKFLKMIMNKTFKITGDCRSHLEHDSNTKKKHVIAVTLGSSTYPARPARPPRTKAGVKVSSVGGKNCGCYCSPRRLLRRVVSEGLIPRSFFSLSISLGLSPSLFSISSFTIYSNSFLSYL